MDGTGGGVAEIFVMFDTQDNMPTARAMVAQKRNPPAAQEEIDRVRAGLAGDKVEVNGRVYNYDERPFFRGRVVQT